MAKKGRPRGEYQKEHMTHIYVPYILKERLEIIRDGTNAPSIWKVIEGMIQKLYDPEYPDSANYIGGGERKIYEN